MTEWREHEVFLTGGTENHWVRLFHSAEPGRFRLGYEVTSPVALAEIAARLDEQRIPWTRRSDLTSDWADDVLRFRDPDGVELELSVQMAELPVPPRQSIIRMRELVHAVWFGRDIGHSESFYQRVLGFRTSDRVLGTIVFMRCENGFHHSLGIASRGIAPNGAGTLDHLCIEVEGFDDVMRARAHALSLGVTLRSDVMHHAASGSRGVYLLDPFSGIAIEFCVGHERLAPDARPRIMEPSPLVADLWQHVGHLREGVQQRTREPQS